MNILLIHNFYRIPGGEDTVFKNEAELLRRHGQNVITYTKDNADMEPRDLLSKAVFSELSFRGVRNLIRANDIDIVHVHNERFLISPSVFLAAKEEKVPVIRTLHNFRMLCINAMLYRDGRICRECLKDGKTVKLPALLHGCYHGNRLHTLMNLRINSYAESKGLYKGVKYIALTDFNKEIFTSAGFDPADIYVKPNFSFGFEVKEGESEDKRRDFLYLGRLDPLKGIEDILSGWKKLPESFVLNVAGGGDEEYEKKLRDDYEAYNIRFLGRVENEEALRLLESSKALIFASKWYEGFPMTIIESFSRKTPVIGLDLGNGGSLLKSIYGSDKPLLKDIGGLPQRIESFDRDRDSGLYDFDADRLKPYTPEENYRMLMEIYEKCIGSR
ncbi:MAG: glycosyltransferase [Lachnospiraceae bacterium]|nr:glycosyltransferase [Lachnospiraceae bacterium]